MDKMLMVRVLENQATAAELDCFSYWMAESEVHRLEFGHVRQLWMLAKDPWPLTTDQSGILRIRALMQQRLQRRREMHALIAGAILLALFTIWFWWPQSSSNKQIGKTLSFYHTSLKDMAVVLEESFHTEIIIGASGLETCQFTGSFSRTVTLDDVMKAVSLSLNLYIENTEDGYTWKGNGC